MRLLESLTTAYTTTTYLSNDNKELDTIYTLSTTSVISIFNGDPKINLSVKVTNEYIDSLSVEELAEFDRQLELKEDNLIKLKDSEVKITSNISNVSSKYNSPSKNIQNDKPKIYKKI